MCSSEVLPSRMRIGAYYFKPTLIPSLATVLVFAAFIALGFWQLGRAEQKRQLQADFAARGQGPALTIGTQLVNASAVRLHQVVVQGYYEPGYQVFLDNQRVHDQIGYDVITPVRIAHSNLRVLVNRGWIPPGPDRQHLPQVNTPQGLQEISGVAMVPGMTPLHSLFKPVAADAANTPDRWDALWLFLDLKRYAALTTLTLQPVVVLLDPESTAGGFVRDWRGVNLMAGIATNQGYAFQWFTMALALVVIYVFVNTRKIK